MPMSSQKGQVLCSFHHHILFDVNRQKLLEMINVVLNHLRTEKLNKEMADVFHLLYRMEEMHAIYVKEPKLKLHFIIQSTSRPVFVGNHGELPSSVAEELARELE